MGKDTKRGFSGTFRRVRAFTARRFREAEARLREYRRIAGVNPPIQFGNVTLFFICLIIAVVVTFLALRSPLFTQQAALMAGIFVLACALWVTEALPLFATSLLAIGLEVILLANPGNWAILRFDGVENPPFQAFFNPLSDPIIFLFLGGFIMAAAAVKRGVDAAMASMILRFFGDRPRNVLLGMILITALFSMWMSNTAATAMMVTMVFPLFRQLEGEDSFQKGLLLAIPFAGNIGGIGTPIGSPPNAVALGVLQSKGLSISFLQWMFIAIPFTILLLLLLWWILWKRYKPTNQNLRLSAASTRLDGKGWYVVTIFCITILLWLTEGVHHLPTSVIALLPVIAFTATGLLAQDEINSLEWNVLLLITGGIALGKGMSVTGLDQVVSGFLPLESAWIFSVIAIVTLLLSTFMSNTAAANLLAPIGIALAFAGGVANQPYAIELTFAIALSASLAMSLPVSTPANTIAYSYGKLESRDFLVNGALIGLVALGIVIFLLPPTIRFWMHLLG
ncbi:MAG TPA: DASS family sodium-coupled anion symporter [Saprospiraceae bacterium]|nr:DASS family sodium-coupled anion symporter [Saprospiraceae bacterium]HMP25884.1 DASS family sodium-coupled anion symporter [Saprospiraceae bacterium]